MKQQWLLKRAHKLREHDIIRHHGSVDWTADYPYEQIAVHVHSQDERGSYTLLIPRNLEVEYRR